MPTPSLKQLKKQLTVFLVRDANHNCDFNCSPTDDIDLLLKHGLEVCMKPAEKINFLSKIFNSSGAAILLKRESIEQCCDILLEVLETFGINPNYHDTYTIYCLQALSSLVSLSGRMEFMFTPERLVHLIGIQRALFEADISFKCVLANSVLLAHCLHYIERVPISPKTFDTKPNDNLPFTAFCIRIFNNELAPSRRLSTVFGIMSVIIDSNFASASKYLLLLISQEYGDADPFLILLGSYCYRLWTNRALKCLSTQELQSLSRDDVFCPIFEFIFRRQADPVDAVRLSALDTFELLVEGHLKADQERLTSILTRVVGHQPIWQKNTLLLMYRFFAAVFRREGSSGRFADGKRAIHWICDCGLHLVDASSDKTYAVAVTLISASKDTSLAQAAADVYALLGRHLDPEGNEFTSWLEALYLFGRSRAFVDKVFNLAPSIPCAIINKFSQRDWSINLATLMQTYRFCLSKKGLPVRVNTPPSLQLLSDASKDQDYQLRLQALGVLELYICKSTPIDADAFRVMNAAIDLATSHSDQGARSQASRTIARVTAHVRKVAGPDFEHWDSLEDLLVSMAESILRHLHPGGVPQSISNALAFVCSFVESLENDKYAETVLVKATEKLLGGDGLVRSPRRLLGTLVLTGLWSGYREDRESAMTVLLRLDLITRVNFVKLWQGALTHLIWSPLPNVNVVASHVVRTVLPTPPTSASSSVTPPQRLLSLPPVPRTLATLHHILTAVEKQVDVAETVKGGLLVVSATGPFYPALNVVRSLVDTCASEKQLEKRMPVDWLFENPTAETSSGLADVASDSFCGRLLKLIFRVARLCSQVIFHSSPEGIIIMPDEQQSLKVLPSGVSDATVADLLSFLECDAARQLDTAHAEALRKVVERPEFLVVNCWRSVREVALLLGGALIRWALPVTTPRISTAQLESISDFFIGQLIQSRHPGAFELTASGFQGFCEVLLRQDAANRGCCDADDFAEWPEQWLGVVVADLTEKQILQTPPASEVGRLPLKYLQNAVSSAYCATRRSAGLPFFIQALLVVLHNTGRLGNLLNSTVEALLDVVKGDAEASTVPSACKNQASLSAAERRLHGLNVLRALVRDATVGPCMSRHLEAILISAFQGLDSSFWMIQNAGLMLYSTMMERIFGVNRTKDCDSKKNRISSSVFFANFRGMREFLLGVLKVSVNCIESPGIAKTKLFAVLNLLTRFLPPIQLATTDGNMVQPFVPLVFKCAGAADIRIRLLAAKALVCLLQPACLPDVAHQILVLVSPQFRQVEPHHPCLRANLTHGLLLQLLEILRSEYWPEVQMDGCQEAIAFLLTEMTSACLTGSSSSLWCCSLVRQTCLACYLVYFHGNDSHQRLSLPIQDCRPPKETSSIPGSLDVAAFVFLFRLRQAFQQGEIPGLFDIVLTESNPQLKCVGLGFLVRNLCTDGKDTKKRRILWYEDAVDIFYKASSPSDSSWTTHGMIGTAVASPILHALLHEITSASKYSHQPFSNICSHASKLLAHLVNKHPDTACNRQLGDAIGQLIAVKTGGSLPVQLGPLLSGFAVLNHNKEATSSLLANYIDPTRFNGHWMIRAEALLAVNVLLGARRRVDDMPLLMSVFSSLVLETDDQVRLMAADTAVTLMVQYGRHKSFTLKPLPQAVLPQLLDVTLGHFGEEGVQSLLDWFYHTIYAEATKPIDQSGVELRLFVSEAEAVGVSPVEFATELCSALVRWTQEEDKDSTSARKRWLATKMDRFVASGCIQPHPLDTSDGSDGVDEYSSSTPRGRSMFLAMTGLLFSKLRFGLVVD